MKNLILLAFIILFSANCFAQGVGINEDSSAADPSAMLDVKSTTKGMLIPRMGTAERIAVLNPGIGLLVFDSDTESFWFNKATGWTELAAGATGVSYWDTDGTNIYNNNTGFVGIGTSTPTQLLTLATPLNTTGFMHIGGDSIIVAEGIGGVSGAIGTVTNHAFRINANSTGKLHIYPLGEVVVGSNQTGSFGRFTVETTNNTYGISHLGEAGNILATRMGGTSAGIGTFSNTNMRIFSNGLSAMFINASNGNVGIGIDFPSYKLEVNGNIRSKEVVVETVNWPDYVFHKDYKLPLLSDVEKFINENHHLPNMYSAKEMEEKGLHLADTQKKMMEKIEELTLYIISQQKEIGALKKEIHKN